MIFLIHPNVIFSDIERALGSLDHVISYYSIAEEVDNVVRTGPSAIGLEEYISVMNKLNNALIYFEKNNPQSVELDNVVSKLSFTVLETSNSYNNCDYLF